MVTFEVGRPGKITRGIGDTLQKKEPKNVIGQVPRIIKGASQSRTKYLHEALR